MSRQRLIFLFAYIGLADCLSIGCSRDEIVESFYYTKGKGVENSMQSELGIVQIEYFIVGRKVPWIEAKALCPSYGGRDMQYTSKKGPSFHKIEESAGFQDLTSESNKQYNSTLAIFSNDEERNWLARMLSESNYRYEGIWIGGRRKNKTSEWRWIGDRKFENTILSNSLIYENYPAWYKLSEEIIAEQNCLLFNRIGHDVPVFIPENCHLHRPFICMRNVKRIPENKIFNGTTISVDGHRYTLYRVIVGDEDDIVKGGTKKLNGGGVSWRRARSECRKRGQDLAMVFTNEAAGVIADLMLKNRPSMENAWLGGWSWNGLDWTWVTSGLILPSIKSPSTLYPPWLEGHPVVVPNNDYDYIKSGRCLILDRHLCPEQIAPVFLDLDCEKERPFICQDGLGFENEYIGKIVRRSIADNEIFEFSEEKMTFTEGEDYCNKQKGQLANVFDSRTLSTCLDKMSELAIDHVWVGGRTMLYDKEWRWVDVSGKLLTAKGLNGKISWCFGENSDFLPTAEPNTCLNLDYEARGFPLFYGLPCNSSQLVLCSIQSHSNTDTLVEASVEDVETRKLTNSTQKMIGEEKSDSNNSLQLSTTVNAGLLNSTTYQPSSSDTQATNISVFNKSTTLKAMERT